MRQRFAGVMAGLIILMAFLPYLPPAGRAYGAVSFGGGELSYPEELVALWDRLASMEGVDLERTDFIGHMTKTYPNPGIVIYKQQTSVSPGKRWKDYEYRNMYCISHSRELAENPNTTMETTAVWYIKKEPYTLENLPEFIKSNTTDEERVRLNFLIMAYAANYEAYQGTVNSDPVVKTADYYLCQSLCTLSEEASFTGDHQHDWEMYRRHATQVANRYHPSGLGSTQVYEDMMGKMETVFRLVWNTARLASACTESSDGGYLFHPIAAQNADGMYYACYPLTAETREILSAATILTYGDWSYEMTESSLNFKSPTGQIPEGGAIAEIDLRNANGIIPQNVGKESVRELHMPVKLGGNWSLTFAQGNLISHLKDGLRIVVGSPVTGENPLPGPSGFSSVARYRHQEQWQADYRVNLRKLDAETGKPLENAWFDILEAFDDGQLSGTVLEDDNWDNDAGSQFLRWEGWDSPYGSGSPDPCPRDQEVTGADGWLREASSPGAGELLPSDSRAHQDIRYYSYTKGYCGGHPEPEDEEDEEAWEEYERQIEICEALVAAGGFYHSLSGKAREMLKEDRDRHYQEFVSLTYDYSARELAARSGYICHNQAQVHEPFENIFDGIHRDTVPIETVCVHSSQYYALGNQREWESGAGEGIAEDRKPSVRQGTLAQEQEGFATKSNAGKVSQMGEEGSWPATKSNAGRADGKEEASHLATEGDARKEKEEGEEEEVLSLAAGSNARREKEKEEEVLNPATESNARRGKRKEEEILSLATESNAGKEKRKEGSDAGKNRKTEIFPGEEVNPEEIWILDEDAGPEEPWEEKQIFPGMIRKAEEVAAILNGEFPKHATPSDRPVFRTNTAVPAGKESGKTSASKTSVRASVGFMTSQVSKIPLADQNYSGRSGADWSFEVCDHRTEGEIHINKRDLLLKQGENEDYDSYGDTQGDGTLEGAVYGLFAATDLIHPDGVTGVVFEKDNLVAVAATDKNGDASFLAITQAPGSVYDYNQGRITATGFAGPENLYRQNQHRYTSNPDSQNGEQWYYPLTDNQSVNGNCWVGRPLFLGSYYVQELTRSEGYELSVYGIEAEVSNRSSWLAGGDTGAKGSVRIRNVSGERRLMEDTGQEETITEIELQSEGAEFGVELLVKNIEESLQPEFYRTEKGKKEVYREWKEAETGYETVTAVPGTLVLIDGKHIEAKAGDSIRLPNGERVTAANDKTVAVTPEKRILTGERGAITTLDTQYIPDLTGIHGEDAKAFSDSCNRALEAIGLEDPGEGAPYFRIALGEDPGLWIQRLYEFLAAEDCPAFNAARLEAVTEEKGEFYGILRYSFLEEGLALPVVYSASDQAFYIRHSLDVEDDTKGYLYQKILLSELSDADYERGNRRYRWIRVPNVRPEKKAVEFYEDLDDIDFVSDRQFKTFWAYGEGEPLRTGDGSIYRKEYTYYVERSGYQTVEKIAYEPLKAEYDPDAGNWRIFVSEAQLPEAGSLFVAIRYQNRFAGENMGLTVEAVPSRNLTGTYIKAVDLVYPGQHRIYEDAGTRQKPAEVLERAILQRIRVRKDIEESSYQNTNSYGEVHEDWFTRLMGGFGKGGEAEACAKGLDNFRFKCYLKSNLTRLYRAEDGSVIWQDRQGRELEDKDLKQEKQVFPELVRKIYTKVRHQTDPLFQDSRDAVTANETLYGDTDGKINENPNPGYTAILETTEQSVGEAVSRSEKSYNYEKFFHAMNVANVDKWDDAAPGYTSWQPIGNASNRSREALMNARVSDSVRQFALDWYLEDELAKLVAPAGKNTGEKQALEGEVSYPDEILDRALWTAIQKAENYLKPFFAYDLDEIYAIDWEEAAGGGTDGDASTLSADVLWEGREGETDPGSAAAGGYCGTSAYLPYGTYVVVEQEPRYAGSEYEKNLEDFRNKHYQTDQPREVSLPSVYADAGGTQTMAERKSNDYCYDISLAKPEMERRYRIRFCQEDQVIQAHNHHGDFEIFPYGMDIGQITNQVPTAPGKGDYFSLSQDEYRPGKNYYNPSDHRTSEPVIYYLSEGQSGQKGIADNYRYSSVSEHQKTATAMHGVQTAQDKEYVPMLVPWGLTAPGGSGNRYRKAGRKEESDKEGGYQGFASVKFHNRFFGARLRLEKLDSETHENILHDGAVFAVYAAKREDTKDGSGQVCFYERDTTISGSRGFLEAMGATDIRPMVRGQSFFERLFGKKPGPGNRYTGVVLAGTPVCEEAERIVLREEEGIQTGEFASYSTTADIKMRAEETDGELAWQLQTIGYLETPQPLGAGVYVICEEKAPAGYVRSAPIALEVYSDKITYYKKGKRDKRVVAAVYEKDCRELTKEGTASWDTLTTARVNVENDPIRLTVEKRKEAGADPAAPIGDKTVTYKVSGRIDGKLADIGNHPDYSYAYENGHYLGYGWRKGTLEYLTARKQAGEQVEIAYEGGVFAGYGYVTRKLETAQDENAYVAGATMTLFDALLLKPSGDTEDHAFEGLVTERNAANNVTRMYVKKGYAGEKTSFVKDLHQNQWMAAKTQRPDTDILYYDLDSLDVISTENVDGRRITYGYDRDYKKVPVAMTESDKANFKRTDTEHSLFAFRGGIAFLEFAGGDFTKLSYSAVNKVLTVGEGTKVYHLNREGNRDCLVDPYTGMAYVPSMEEEGEVMVWAVRIHRDEYGNRIARDKITTSRLATVGENQDSCLELEILDVVNHSGHEIPEDCRPSYYHTESGSVSGTWKPEDKEESHRETTVITNKQGQNLNGEVLTDDNNGSFSGTLNPVYDDWGLPQYYQRSEESYDKGTELYDRNGDFVRYQDSDNLERYNNNAYRINCYRQLHDGKEQEEKQNQKKLYHRQGEGYILENTWLSSDKTPNDPFHTEETEGQPDILKRVPAGHYILEELKSPAGYVTALPVGVTVHENSDMQNTEMVDKTIKIEISKVDAPLSRQKQVWEIGADGKRKDKGAGTERTGGYTYGLVPGAELTLYAARKIYSAEEPGGYYLEKISEEPFVFESTNSRTGKKEWITARWVTGTEPIYAEGIPAGYYLLEETASPEGFIAAEPINIVIRETAQVQIFTVYNDHTKTEIEKYTGQGKERRLLPGAGFALYEASTDANGEVIFSDSRPEYDSERVVDQWVSSDREACQSFIPAFEAMYQDYGAKEGASVRWREGKTEHTARCVSLEVMDASAQGGHEMRHPPVATMILETETGEKIRVVAYGEDSFEYQFDYCALPMVNSHACAYTSLDGVRRFDYLPAGRAYVLVETEAPKGYAKAAEKVIRVGNTEDIYRYTVENTEGRLYISKVAEEGTRELAGAKMRLYRAGDDGEFIAEENYLQEEWITGEDGHYTDEDFVNGRILKGYDTGDLRPHEVRRLADGRYWLSEVKSPDYYTTFLPVAIDYRQEGEIRIVRVSNRLASGSLEVEKTDSGGKILEGAVFELAAYHRQDMRNPVLCQRLNCIKGKLRAEGLCIGDIGEDGRVEPYLYKLREIVPPKGYAATTRIFTWEFSANQNGDSFRPGEEAKKNLRIVNEPTRISLGKADFDQLGVPQSRWFLAGAELAVYELTGRNEKDELLYDADNPQKQWVTDGTEYELEGLAGGQSYLLKELSAPKGYELMEPVIFTLSGDGRRISDISSHCHTITVHTGDSDEEGTVFDKEHPDKDRIQAVTVKGRYPIRVEYELWSAQNQMIASWTGSRDGHTLCRRDFPEAEGVCMLRERVCYNNGSSFVSSQRTERLSFDADGLCRIPGREARKAEWILSDSSGRELDSFLVSEVRQEKTIPNLELSGDSEIFQNGRSYLLTEETLYSDGSRQKSGRMQFVLNENGAVFGIVAADLKTKVCLSKTEITGNRELPGCHMRLKDQYGEKLISWVSGEEPYRLEGFLMPGGIYYLEETYPREGYAYAEEIRFTVSLDGSTDTVVMKDCPTHVFISKTDITGEEELSGNRLRIKTMDGQEVVSWVSGEKPYEITGLLKAGETYILEELSPRDGFALAEEISFRVSRDGKTDRVRMKNDKTKVRIRKVDAETKEPLSGAFLQICDERGKVWEQWISDGGSHEIIGRLKAGEHYYLREKRSPDGYQLSEDLEFWMPEGNEWLDVTLENRKEEKPEKPVKPERPGGPKAPHIPPQTENRKEPGRISAVYSPEVPGAAGRFSEILPGRVPLLAAAGEGSGGRVCWFLLLLSFFGMIFTFSAIRMTKHRRFVIINRIRKESRKKQRKKK